MNELFSWTKPSTIIKLKFIPNNEGARLQASRDTTGSACGLVPSPSFQHHSSSIFGIKWRFFVYKTCNVYTYYFMNMKVQSKN